MKRTVTVFAPGTVVHVVGSLNHRATVTQVCLNGGNVQYHIVWWTDSDRKTAWVEDHEVCDANAMEESSPASETIELNPKL